MSGWPLGSWLRQWLLWQQGLLLNFWFVFVVIIGINTIIDIIVIVVFTTTIIITVIIFVTTYVFAEGKCKCCWRRPSCQRYLPAVIFFILFFCIPLPIRLFSVLFFLYSFAPSIVFHIIIFLFLLFLCPFNSLLFFFCDLIFFQ